MNATSIKEKPQAKTCKELAAEYGVHVNTIYEWRNKIAVLLNLKKKAKKLTPKQVAIFDAYYK